MDELKSRSQKKREAEALQKLGVEFLKLSPEKLDRLPLEPILRNAIDDAKRIRSHGALRRQVQLIGKLMRSADEEALQEAYQKLQNEDAAATESFHTMEYWRDRLINGSSAELTEFINLSKTEEIQLLRQLIKKAQTETKPELKTAASRALFRFIRSCLQ